ncbi:hypothetical protein ACI48D_10775 [Massilia sp. LXY-6]
MTMVRVGCGAAGVPESPLFLLGESLPHAASNALAAKGTIKA